MKTKIKLEEGKWYKTRDGQVVGPMEYDPEEFPYEAKQELDGEYKAWFRMDGTWEIEKGVEHRFDIVEEVHAPTPAPIHAAPASTAQQDFLDSTSEQPNKLERLEARVAELESMLA